MSFVRMSPALMSACCAARWNLPRTCILGSPNMACTSASSMLISATRYTANMSASRAFGVLSRCAEASMTRPWAVGTWVMRSRGLMLLM